MARANLDPVAVAVLAKAPIPGLVKTRLIPEIALMEDVALSRRLRRLGRPACLRRRVRTSGRRWESRGVLRTVLLMWRLRLLYALGVAPERLARQYYEW